MLHSFPNLYELEHVNKERMHDIHYMYAQWIERWGILPVDSPSVGSQQSTITAGDEIMPGTAD